jgi:hypothetical protein
MNEANVGNDLVGGKEPITRAKTKINKKHTHTHQKLERCAILVLAFGGRSMMHRN